MGTLRGVSALLTLLFGHFLLKEARLLSSQPEFWLNFQASLPTKQFVEIILSLSPSRAIPLDSSSSAARRKPATRAGTLHFHYRPAQRLRLSQDEQAVERERERESFRCHFGSFLAKNRVR